MRRDGFVLAGVLVAATVLMLLAAALGAAVRQGLALTARIDESVARETLTCATVEALKYEYQMHGLPAAYEFERQTDAGTLHVRVEYARELQREVAVYAYRVTTAGNYGTTTQTIWLPAGEINA